MIKYLLTLVIMLTADFANGAVLLVNDKINYPPPIDGIGYHLVQNWDFRMNSINKGDLDRQFDYTYLSPTGNSDHLNDEWERYKDNDNIVVGAAQVLLKANLVGSLSSGHIESGMLQSKWSGKYGYYEARLKLPRGRGLWPAFWLTAIDGVWPPEIDVVEVVDNGHDTTKNSFHYLHGSSGDQPIDVQSKLDHQGRYSPGYDYSLDFHTFAVEWTPNAVTHYVDDQLVVSRQFHWRHTDGSDAGAAHVLLNLAVGGRWPGPPISPDEFPAEMNIQFIRIWQK